MGQDDPESDRPLSRDQGGARTDGGKLECFYFTFGERDGFVIVEVPDTASAAAAAIAVASTGSFRSVTSQELTTRPFCDPPTRRSPAGGVACRLAPCRGATVRG